MVKKVIVRQTGTSVSATIPSEMAERFNIKKGDTLFAIETENGVLLTPFDPEFAETMEHYRRGAKKYQEALRELAK
jgi:putative addiction module antidote